MSDLWRRGEERRGDERSEAAHRSSVPCIHNEEAHVTAGTPRPRPRTRSLRPQKEPIVGGKRKRRGHCGYTALLRDMPRALTGRKALKSRSMEVSRVGAMTGFSNVLFHFACSVMLLRRGSDGGWLRSDGGWLPGEKIWLYTIVLCSNPNPNPNQWRGWPLQTTRQRHWAQGLTASWAEEAEAPPFCSAPPLHPSSSPILVCVCVCEL
jgi:hypothetical protein